MTKTGSSERAVEADSLLERGLLASALEFYGAAAAVIEYAAGGATRPRLRWDLAGLADVREAMGALEQRVAFACRAGLTAERIARITRLEPDLVEAIVARHLPAGEPTASR